MADLYRKIKAVRKAQDRKGTEGPLAQLTPRHCKRGPQEGPSYGINGQPTC